MTFQEAIAALQQRFPEAPIGATALGGQYYDRAVGIIDYQQREDWLYIGHGVNGKEMWVYYSEAKNVICCGDKGN